jgi:hypothetical protein
MLTSAVEDELPSEAVSRSVYVPFALNLAVV